VAFSLLPGEEVGYHITGHCTDPKKSTGITFCWFLKVWGLLWGKPTTKEKRTQSETP